MNALKHTFCLIAILIGINTCAQSQSEVALVADSDVDVTYDRPESYIRYLNVRNLPKDDIYKDFYTDKFIFDLGKIKSNTIHEVAIPFTNTSEDYIKITVVNEICGCLRANFPIGPAGKLKPGETRKGKLKFNTKGMSGKVKRAVEVRTFANRKDINYLIWIKAEIIN